MKRLVQEATRWEHKIGVAEDIVTFESAVPNRTTGCGSPVLASSGEGMFHKAIGLTLEAPPEKRVELFERLLQEIVTIVSGTPEMRPWKYDQPVEVRPARGTDGSRIFSGGSGLSLVVDTEERLWRGRTYEDFETRYKITGTSCEVESMTPKYGQIGNMKSLNDGRRRVCRSRPMSPPYTRCSRGELLGHRDLNTMMIHAHALNEGGRGARSPADMK